MEFSDGDSVNLTLVDIPLQDGGESPRSFESAAEFQAALDVSIR
jgi:hypothetical protein